MYWAFTAAHPENLFSVSVLFQHADPVAPTVTCILQTVV